MPTAGYIHPITFNIYLDDASARAHAPVKSVTVNQLIQWRPEADATCPDTGYGAGFAWRDMGGTCYNGYAFTITFDLTALNYNLPDQFIYGVAYNTNTWGYNPLGVPGPYESLNVGLNQTSAPSVGFDVDADSVYWNTVHAAWYTDGGANGSGIFRADSNWAPYVPAVKFTATWPVAANANACKNGGWQSLARANATTFKNQGDCIQYVNTGK
jgi:hypothetical protein